MNPKKNNMTTGIALIIIGLGITFIGVMKLTTSGKAQANAQAPVTTMVQQQPEVINEPVKTAALSTNSESNSKTETFENLIAVATADGQLTNNEKKLLQNKATELGLNYSDFSGSIETQLQQKQQTKETDIIDKDKQKGLDFEKLVIQKFSKKYFTLLEWAGDKYVNGTYAETTTQPDIKLRFTLHDIKHEFAVECKYRSYYFENSIEWCKDWQLKNYRKYATEKNIPVFIVIGIGGTASVPDKLFVVPLDKIESLYLSETFLNQFQKFNFNEKDFFYDPKRKSLN